MAELKPCPFCGGTDIRIDLEDEYNNWRIMCYNCSGRMIGYSKSRTITKWNTRTPKERGGGEVNNYIIVDVNCVIATYHAKNIKEAICKYAENCGLQIALTIFEKAVQNLELVEIIELFNQNCLGDSDKIERVFTGYTTLYDEHK